MADTRNRGKSSHAAKHFCSIDQAAAMGEEAVRVAYELRPDGTFAPIHSKAEVIARLVKVADLPPGGYECIPDGETQDAPPLAERNPE